MSMKGRWSRVPLVMTSLVLAGLSPAGCGESAPPPITREGFQAAKQDREKIIMKEYGQKAFEKGERKASGKSKQP